MELLLTAVDVYYFLSLYVQALMPLFDRRGINRMCAGWVGSFAFFKLAWEVFFKGDPLFVCSVFS